MSKTDGETSSSRRDDFDLTCWYINQRRIGELVPDFQRFSPNAFTRGLSDAKHAILAFLRTRSIESIGQLLTTDTARNGILITHHGDFYCKGLGGIAKRAAMGEVYARLDWIQPKLKLRMPVSTEHLTSASAPAMLKGHQRLFVFAVITKVAPQEITAVPYVIGSLVLNLFEQPHDPVPGWAYYREVHPQLIDQFGMMDSVDPSSRDDLKILKSIPESRIKSWFAEIIAEPIVPKDWGGEQSDLFSTHVTVKGRPLSTAFAFKGPARFSPLTIAKMGKNGDQMVRLFNEPAELLVLQHCHEVTTPVRSMMKAFANQAHNPRWFSIIDGYATIRLLRAARKIEPSSNRSQ